MQNAVTTDTVFKIAPSQPSGDEVLTPAIGVDGEVKVEGDEDVTFAMVLADEVRIGPPRNGTHPDVIPVMTLPVPAEIQLQKPTVDNETPEFGDALAVAPFVPAKYLADDEKQTSTTPVPNIARQSGRGQDTPLPVIKTPEVVDPERSAVVDAPERTATPTETRQEQPQYITQADLPTMPQDRSMAQRGDGADVSISPRGVEPRKAYEQKDAQPTNAAEISPVDQPSGAKLSERAGETSRAVSGEVVRPLMPEASVKPGEAEKQTASPIQLVNQTETGKIVTAFAADEMRKAIPVDIEKNVSPNHGVSENRSDNGTTMPRAQPTLDPATPPMLPVHAPQEAGSSMRTEVVKISQVQEVIVPPVTPPANRIIPTALPETVARQLATAQVLAEPMQPLPETSPDEMQTLPLVTEGQSVSRAQPVAAGPPGFAYDVAKFTHVSRQLMEVAARHGEGPVELTLSPEELGRVRMNFSMLDGVLTVSLAAERGETLALMRRNIDALLQDFGEIGFSEINMEFSGFGDSSASRDGSSDAGLPEAFAPDPSVGSEPSARHPARISLGFHQSTGLDLRL